MEQGTLTTPNIASLDRITGKAVFTKTGDAFGVDLGDILMHRLDYGPKREETSFHIRGNTVLAVEETTSVSPVFSIDGQQFTSQNMPLMLLGTRNADVTQSSGTAATASITAKLGKTFDLGARNITNVVVTVAAAAKAADVDYFLDAAAGLIRFPEVAAGIADAAAVTVTFDKPAITRDSYTAFNNLNLQGKLQLFEFDNRSLIPKNEWLFDGTMTAEKGGDADPLKHRQWSLRFAVNGQPTCLRRQA
jgi:hypothetical protein